MKKAVAMALACSMVLTLTACGNKSTESTQSGTNQTTTQDSTDTAADDTQTEDNSAEDTEPSAPVELNVTSTYAGEDSNAPNFKKSYKEWEEKTGNTVNDTSQISDETFKARISADFEAGSEPDVLYFFTGADANSFVEAGKVVSLEDIRKEFPDYGSNMVDEQIPASIVDNKKYVLPSTGYWEGLYVNTELLKEVGVEVPGTDYTWDQFLEDCQKISDAGYTPIAAALGSVPHYWWEYSIFNNTSPSTHFAVPESTDDELGQKWVQGMEDIIALYEAGYFPKNTNSATDDETVAMFTSGKAAFLIDGSWKVGGIVSACQSDPDDKSTLDEEKLAKFDVVYIPSKGGERKATDIIGGASMGYYITKKAWDDPDKKKAAVDFVSYMTSDEVLTDFANAAVASTSLKTPPTVDESSLNSLQAKAMAMLSKITSVTPAAQDIFNGQCRESTFEKGMPKIVTGEVTAKDAVQTGLDVYKTQSQE